jgi:hypothetical protein
MIASKVGHAERFFKSRARNASAAARERAAELTQLCQRAPAAKRPARTSARPSTSTVASGEEKPAHESAAHRAAQFLVVAQAQPDDARFAE